jgi:MFS transporter, FHS family, glucose/mannose:H+ symporter
MKSKLVFFSACLGMLLFGIGLITLGSVATGLQSRFHLDKIGSGTLFSILPFGILMGSLVFGPVCDRYGYKIFLLLSCVLMFIGFQGIAFAPSLILLKFCVFLFGFGGGAINGACNAVVSDISADHKSANLSLLGVFFAIGALGMPVILGSLNKLYSFQSIVSAIGFLPVLVAILIFTTPYPGPKQDQNIPFHQGLQLLKQSFLLYIGFFLFCQSSIEGVINNWTTTYLSQKLNSTESNALYGLSLFVAGMAITRILLGSVFRNVSDRIIILVSLLVIGIGCFILWGSHSNGSAISGLVACGAGLAAGFPVMFGLLGNHYSSLSGTAFGLVLTIALFGNMLTNYLMGFITEAYGITHLTTVLFVLLLGMLFLSLKIFKINQS